MAGYLKHPTSNWITTTPSVKLGGAQISDLRARIQSRRLRFQTQTFDYPDHPISKLKAISSKPKTMRSKTDD